MARGEVDGRRAVDRLEAGRFDDYVPGDDVLGAITTPVEILISEGSLPEFAQAARRLAARLGGEITRTPGTHFPYLDHPDELARAVKERVRQTVA